MDILTGTSGFSYKELTAEWAERIREQVWNAVYVMFNREDDGGGPRDLRRTFSSDFLNNWALQLQARSVKELVDGVPRKIG